MKKPKNKNYQSQEISPEELNKQLRGLVSDNKRRDFPEELDAKTDLVVEENFQGVDSPCSFLRLSIPTTMARTVSEEFR